MKKVLSIILALFMLTSCTLIFASCSGKDDEIIVQTNAYFAPFEYMEGSSTIVGVDVDIMNLVGEKLGKNVKFDNVEFGVIIDNVSAGKICDVGAAGITITDARAEKVDFSTPYYTSVQYVIYKTGTLTVDGNDNGTDYILWDSLAGKVLGVQADTTGDFYVYDEINACEGVDDYDFTGVLYNSGASMKRFDSAQLATDGIGIEIDAAIIDQLPASYIVDKNSGLSCAALYYAGEDGEAPSPTSEQYAICVTKGNTELLDAINSVLAELMKVDEATGESQIDALVKKHMGITD